MCPGRGGGAGSDLRNTSAQAQGCGPANQSLAPQRPAAPVGTLVPSALGIQLPASPQPDPPRSQLGLRVEAGQSASPSMCPPSSPWVKSIPSQSEKTPAWPLAARSVARVLRPPQRGSVRRRPCPGPTTPRQFLSYDTYCCFREKNGKQILKKLVFRPNTKSSTTRASLLLYVGQSGLAPGTLRRQLPPCDGLSLARCYLGRPGRPSEHGPC